MAVRRIAAGTLAALVLPALLAGCGGDSSVADPPVASSPSSPTSSAPPAHETAEHFIRRWAEAEKQMENTGKTGAYLAMSGECRSCRQLAADIKRFYSAGGFVRWTGWQIISIADDGPRATGKVFEVKVESGPTRYRESSSSPIKRLAGGRSTHQLVIRPTSTGWRVLEKAQIAQ